MRRRGEFKISLREPRDGEILRRFLRAVKNKECALGMGCYLKLEQVGEILLVVISKSCLW